MPKLTEDGGIKFTTEDRLGIALFGLASYGRDIFLVVRRRQKAGHRKAWTVLEDAAIRRKAVLAVNDAMRLVEMVKEGYLSDNLAPTQKFYDEVKAEADEKAEAR